MAITFRVQLVGVTKPPIWRKIVTPNTATFLDLHRAIQDAFGWADYHLWCFAENKRAYDGWHIECEEGNRASRRSGGRPNPRTQLVKLIGSKPFYYTYDFGDNWLCSVKVLASDDVPVRNCSCTDGKGEDPGEDIGGVWGLMQQRAGLLTDEE